MSNSEGTDPTADRTPGGTNGKKVAKTDARRILTTPLVGCLGEPELCSQLDAALRSEVEKAISSSRFTLREEAVKRLSNHGFLSIDAYSGALDNVASDVGTDVVISEDFRRQKSDHCEVRTTVVVAKHHFALAEFGSHIPCPSRATNRGASLLKDPETGAFLIVPAFESPGFTRVQGPSCVSCPDPH